MRNKKRLVRLAAILGVVIVLLGALTLGLALADTTPATTKTQVTAADAGNDPIGAKAIASGIAIGFAALGGGIGMGIFGGKAAEGISRQPEAEGKIRTTFMLGLVFIETAIIYALLVVILIIFVL